MEVDFLIIGQGLAGSLLAWELIQRGCSVMVIDNGAENASQIAAGLINPITGLRFVKASDTESLLATSKRYYSNLTRFFNEDFFIEKPMLRIFSNENELSNATKRFHNPDYRHYIKSIEQADIKIENIATPLGFLEQEQTGYLLTKPLLNCLRTFFISKGSYRLSVFDYDQVKLEPQLSWQDIYPGRIIFSEGFLATLNPWFSWLPFQPVKGEILTLQHEIELPDKILNFGKWLIPLNPNQIRIGATFDRENKNTQITDIGKAELLNALSKLSPELLNITLMEHCANIRPCTLDRHPFLGIHPGFQSLAIFNGFGAKGSLQIPWHAAHFADHLLTEAKLLPACNIGRHLAKYFKL